MRNFISILFIISICAIYFYRSKNNYPNSDERSSILIALGKYQSLTDSSGNFVSLGTYEQRLDYKKYDNSNVKIRAVFQNVVNDNTNGYIYYLALAAIIKFIGLKIAFLKAFSILFAAINLYLIYIIAGLFNNSLLTQWIALILTMINPVFYEDATLIRSYMLMLTGVLLSILFLVRIIDSTPITKRSEIVLFFLSVLLAAGSHYLCFPLLLAEFCYIVTSVSFKLPDFQLII
jgi:hypothetical protein